jgi:exopolysaccharide biosynthesis operon protein EpsL
MLSSLRSDITRSGTGSANVNQLLRRACPLGLALSVIVSAPVAAGPGDALHLYAGLGYAHDDNLLRVAEGQPAFDNTLADSWTQAEAGLIFGKQYSRQKLFAQAKFSKAKFNHFTQLDYDGKDLQANWDWQLGNHLEGDMGASYNQTLAPYTDFRSNERNLRQQRRTFFDGAWRFHPSWRVRAGVASEKFTYELAAQRYNNRTEDAVETGFDYLAPSGSTVGLVARRLEGDYTNGRPVGGLIIDDSYRQDEIKAKVYWIASGTTTVQVLGGWVRRRQASLGEPDTSGINGKVSASYTPRARFSVTAAAWRDFAPLESTLVSYTRNKGASLGAGWDASAKIRVDANALYERRNYNALRALSTVGNGAGLDDTFRSATLRATYAPIRAIALSAGWSHQARSGSTVLGIGSFTSNSISFNASAQF